MSTPRIGVDDFEDEVALDDARRIARACLRGDAEQYGRDELVGALAVLAREDERLTELERLG